MTSASGVVLVQAGTELTEALIALLFAAGVATVAIAGAPLTPEVREQRRRAIEARFAGHEADPWMAALKDIVVRLQVGDETDGTDA